MLLAQPLGFFIQLSSAQKNGSARIAHPISGSRALGSGVSGRITFSNSSLVAAPFFVPNESHAIESGRTEYFTKNAPPPMWLYGRFSLKRNGDPGLNAENIPRALGCQKFTSSGREARR